MDVTVMITTGIYPDELMSQLTVRTALYLDETKLLNANNAPWQGCACTLVCRRRSLQVSARRKTDRRERHLRLNSGTKMSPVDAERCAGASQSSWRRISMIVKSAGCQAAWRRAPGGKQVVRQKLRGLPSRLGRGQSTRVIRKCRTTLREHYDNKKTARLLLLASDLN